MLRGGNSRASRAQSPNRGRGYRGRGSTSRGASNSSGKSNVNSYIPTGPRARQEALSYHRSNSLGRKAGPYLKKHYSSSKRSGTSSIENSPENFENERFENAAKRTQLKGLSSETVNVRGGRGDLRGTFSNKQVRFANLPAAESNEDTPSKSHSPATPNPFAPARISSPFGTPATMASNTFATAKAETSNPPFGTPTASFNPFAPAITSSPLGNTANVSANPFASAPAERSKSPFGTPSASFNPFAPATTSSPVGNLSTEPVNPFAPARAETSKNLFGVPSASVNPFAPATTASPVGNLATEPVNPFATAKAETSKNPFGIPSASVNPFASTSATSPLGTPAIVPANPFATTKTDRSKNPLSTPNPSPNPFGGPLQPFPTSNVFGTSSPSSSPFEAPSKSANTPNVFGKPSENPRSLSTPAFGSFKPDVLPTTLPLTSTVPTQVVAPFKATTFNEKLNAKLNTNGFGSKSKPAPLSSPTPVPATGSALSKSMDQLLRKEGISPPVWPTTPGDPVQKAAIEALWKASKVYRAKVRSSLIRAGFLDDPDKPKKLSEAIDFKGTCEDMCPEFEKVTRIMEHDVQGAEKELAPDGSTLWPAPHKMVKALARSAAGQDAPLPMDVRLPAALRRTLDYLLHTVLGDEGDLSSVHGFLWDRTRAIRRDFVFQQSSMTPGELFDQVYCLERITRFHAIALHQMSREGAVAEDFVEQQEVEQLGKALLSLIHAYEDCQAQSIHCENEAEFRAYYVLFNSHNPAILEMVQNWGWKFWGESDQVKLAVNLVETLQNIWDLRGPLNPHSATDVAQNGYSRFFSIVGDKKVSYTMACFAEIHFNSVRKSALKTILSSYRKQRDQTKDWTLTRLNAYLQFDDEEDIIEFGEAYGLQFQDSEEETYLSFESEDVADPFPPLKQRYSYALVERKRGNHSLPAVIDATVYDENEESDASGDEEPLFVKDTRAKSKPMEVPVFPSPSFSFLEDAEIAARNGSRDMKQFAPDLSPKPSLFFGGPSAGPPQPSVEDASKSSDVAPSHPTEQLPIPQLTFGGGPSFDSTRNPTFRDTPQAYVTQAPTQQSKVSTDPVFNFMSNTTSSGGSQSTSSADSAFQDKSARGPSSFATAEPHAAESFISTQMLQNQPTSGIQTQKPLFSQPPGPPTLAGFASKPVEYSPSIPLKPTQDLSSASSKPSAQGASSFSKSPAQESAPAFQDKTAGRLSSVATTKAPAVDNKKAQLDNLARWVTVGDGGIIDQFTENYVEQLLREAAGTYVKEEAYRLAKEEEEQARAQADLFRYRSLATKYGHRWREAAHRMWLRRKGRQARKARQEMAESLRASRVLRSANIVEDFRASTNSSRRGSLESLLDSTRVLNGVHDSNSEIRAIVQTEEPKVSSKKRRPERSTNSPASSINGHKRVKSDNPLRRSILSDPSYLQGGSRIHLMSKYDSRDETRRQVSGVQTDYFRLKARGISTLPDGTPLASSVAKNILHQKRSFDGISKPATPKKSMMHPPAVRSVPSKPVTQSEDLWKGADSSEVIKAMKARARALLGEDQQPHKKRTLEDEAELFARAKRVREKMDEGSQWYQEQIRRETESRSVS